jgi:hypothetical protein
VAPLSEIEDHDWSFLRPFEQWWPPRKIRDNPFPTVCSLRAAGSPKEIEACSPAWLPAEVKSFWSVYGSGELFKDIAYGQWGLRIFSPAASAKDTKRYHEIQPGRLTDDDLVVGEFLGDSDLLVVHRTGSVLVSLPIDKRPVWHQEPSLSLFLRKYVDTQGDKYWERKS